MKHLKIVKSEEKDWYGFVDPKTGNIMINLQLLWEDSPDEDHFILNYALTYTHELLHTLVWDETTDEHLYKEEEIIRNILGEPWNEKEQKLYIALNKEEKQ